MKLSELQSSEKGVIVKVNGYGAFRKRILEMGFVKGQVIKVIKNAPLKDPIEYELMGYYVSLRRSEAKLIEVSTLEEAKQFQTVTFDGILDEEILKITAKEKRKIINVALVGNPNAGKTTLFNFASGSREHVGNYAGVTIDAKQAEFKLDNYKIEVIDLPGTYSLTAYSPEELYVRTYILNETPDIVLNVVDASNIERNLYLTTQLIDMDIKVVVALNMYDELQANGNILDFKMLGKMLGIPFVPTVSSKGKGIKELFEKIIDVYEDKDPIVRHIHINYGDIVENSILRLRKELNKNIELKDSVSTRFLAIKLLEQDQQTIQLISGLQEKNEILKLTKSEIYKIEKEYNETSEAVITDSKYGFISGALKETFSEGIINPRRTSEIIDAFVTHKLWGFPIFLFFIWIMFQATFSLGVYPMKLIELLVNLLGDFLKLQMPDGSLKDLLIDVIINGVGRVIVFLPNILIMFLFISFMEDTGYMARAAFIMDKLMHKMGLHGKSFIPLIMGFGCNVPAIMSTRTISNRNNRILTILINPFMSCSARLPVYILIISIFFTKSAGTVLFCIYLVGILFAIASAKILKKIYFSAEETPFVMELPPYRVPNLSSTLKNMWNKTLGYLKKISNIILVASVIIWCLGYFPRNIKYSQNYDELIKHAEIDYRLKISNLMISDSTKIDFFKLEKDGIILDLKLKQGEEKNEKSYIGMIGKALEPVMSPLGFDWKMTISILAGVAGKEIVVSTMSQLYASSDSYDSDSFKEIIRKQRHKEGPEKGKFVFNPLVAFVFLLFILIYFPCIAVIAAVSKEAGWKWALFLAFYTTILAWLVSFIVYQVGSLFL